MIFALRLEGVRSEGGRWVRKGAGRGRPELGVWNSMEQHGAREAGEQVGWEQGGSQCLILGGLVEETLGSHGRVLVGLVTAVQGATEPGFCFYMKREVRSAAESEGGPGSRGWRSGMERRSIRQSAQRVRKKFLEQHAGIAGQP